MVVSLFTSRFGTGLYLLENIIIIYFKHVVHIISTIKQRRSTKEKVSHNALQDRCLLTTTLVGEKHFNSTPNIASYIHHKTRDPVV